MNVRVWTIDRESVLHDLENWAEGLKADENVAAIVLFGSLARGDCTAQSDADVVVILYTCEEPFRDRIAAFMPDKLAFPVDVFPYTLAEVHRSLVEGWGVMRPALAEGVVLFERDNALDAFRNRHRINVGGKPTSGTGPDTTTSSP